MLERAIQIGERLQKRFLVMKEKYAIVGDVRGIGDMTVLELLKDRDSKDPVTEETGKIVQYCVQNGVLVPTAGINKSILQRLVSLVITDEQLDEALDVIDEAIAGIS